jgi:hypothetical protein
MMDAEQLWCQRFEDIEQEEWENVCQHVENVNNISGEALLKTLLNILELKMEWTAGMNQVTCLKMKVSQEWKLQCKHLRLEVLEYKKINQGWCYFRKNQLFMKK